jgi:DNA-binding GntR family transcriptional regulator
MATPVVYRTIREQIVEQLRREVLSGEIEAGESLREQRLAERFGVSRGPIRDALLQLTQEGLLIGEPNRGVRVGRGPSPLVQPLVVDLRRRIEAFALQAIFAELTADDVGQLRSIVAQFGITCRTGKMSDVIEHDLALHRWLVERVGDAELVQLWLTTIVRMRLPYSRHRHLSEAHTEHEAIVEAIARRDPAGALQALESNIQ